MSPDSPWYPGNLSQLRSHAEGEISKACERAMAGG
jgi:hypothetical protein